MEVRVEVRVVEVRREVRVEVKGEVWWAAWAGGGWAGQAGRGECVPGCLHPPFTLLQDLQAALVSAGQSSRSVISCLVRRLRRNWL